MAAGVTPDLFSPVLSSDRMHPQFAELKGSLIHQEARALMNDLLGRMGDPNGKFIRHFQGDAFHSRLFELACFAYLESAGLTIERTFAQPDFLASGDALSMAVEAVTANPPTGQSTDISLRQMVQLSDTEILEKVTQEFPTRMGNILRKKLAHGYHELPQCQNKPLVFMVAPFFEAGSVFYTDDALMYPLFGAADPALEKVDPFFRRPNAESVSAVIYCNQFTVSRFFRLTTNFNIRDTPRVIRHGTCYRAHKNLDYSLSDFRYIVGSAGAPKESWADGVTVFENPHALVPLPRHALPCSSHISVREGHVYREVRGFHPVVSFTQIETNPSTDGPAALRAGGIAFRDHI
jgi:hypothetical protein